MTQLLKYVYAYVNDKLLRTPMPQVRMVLRIVLHVFDVGTAAASACTVPTSTGPWSSQSSQQR